MSDTRQLFRETFYRACRGYVWGMRFGCPGAFASGIVLAAYGTTDLYFTVLWSILTAFGTFVAWVAPVRNIHV